MPEKEEYFYYLDDKNGIPLTHEGWILFQEMINQDALPELRRRVIEVKSTRKKVGKFMSRQDVAFMDMWG